ncbi:hypothetical protein ESCO_003698 [Escovopsis weberi]|uniref:Uncharacterized protein n=1 Tax=Escovopsis weberi TaxID=150374 RepID=A0A0M9VX94_ESCWE|nr:hypothetical protein ESCO_003698 [Escovopsis weberi]
MEGKPNAPKASRSKRPRRPAACTEKPKRTSSTLNPNHGRSRKQEPIEAAAATTTTEEEPPSAKPAPAQAPPEEMSSILFSVKSNPRIRKRKMIDGEEVAAPTVGKRRSVTQGKNAANPTGYKPTKAELKLPPLRPERVAEPAPAPAFGRPQPLEPSSPPDGPLAMLSVNMRAAMTFSRPETFYLEDPLVKLSPQWPAPNKRIEQSLQQQQLQQEQERQQQQQQQQQQRQGDADREEAEADAALALAGLKTGSPVVSRVADPASLEGDLKSWGSSWSCN